jgi:hypothetical protein
LVGCGIGALRVYRFKLFLQQRQIFAVCAPHCHGHQRGQPRRRTRRGCPDCAASFVWSRRRSIPRVGRLHWERTQTSMRVATQDLPRTAHPFYTHLNQILAKARFDGLVSVCSTPARRLRPSPRHTAVSPRTMQTAPAIDVCPRHIASGASVPVRSPSPRNRRHIRKPVN